jgi:hypothetical protein
MGVVRPFAPGPRLLLSLGNGRYRIGVASRFAARRDAGRRYQMVPTVTNRGVLIATVLVAAVGVVDALVGRAYDLVVVFTIVGALQLVLLARLSSRRPHVPVRADLVAWLTERAALEGDSVEAEIDRALAAFRDDLIGPPASTRDSDAGPA